ILPVDVKMIKVAAFGRVALGQLRVAGKLVAQTDEPLVSFETPRVVFKGAQIESVKRIHTALAGKGRIMEFGRPVFLPEEKAERVFRISSAPAVSAADADAGIDLKSFRAVGINQFNRSRSFPCPAVLARVCMNARRRVKQISQIRHEG